MKEKLNYRKQALYHITKVLWHLDIFRRSFRELSGHACMAESCIFCALKELFGQLQFSQESALPPDALRRALAESFFDQQRFQLGFMDDAAECFENILLRIHYHIASGEVEDMCNARHCIPHQKFAMTLVEQSVCEACHVTSEPLSYTQMVHYVSASALTTQARQAGKSAHPDFGQLLRKAGGMGDIRDCPSSCGAKIQICRALMNRPEIVSVGVVWDSERPTLQHIMAVFATVGTSLRLSDVFHSVMDHRWASATTHALVGVVTYYGKHYSTFFFHTKLRVWIYFDDATVREIGPRFEQVVEKCRRGRYQPLLLLYAVQGGTPVATDGAPKTIVQIPVNRDTGKARCSVKTSPASGTLPSPSLPLRRSVTPSPEKTQTAPSSTSPRRAITPNPDVAHHRTISRSYSDYQNLSDIQASIFNNNPESEPSYISRKAVESVLTYQKQNPVQRNGSINSKEGDKKVSLQRTYSDGIAMPEHLNIPRRRDSGNWSGDRNSASSSSSMENPYLYLVGKLQARNQAVPRSPTSTKPPGEAFLDPGYDSYSLSSNDSLPLQQGLKHNLQLAQIPEHLPARLAGDECEHLCLEADQLLDKSKQLEEAKDLETALVLCQAAAGKARAAMDAPYNNPQTLTFARMKHNTCVMRVRSLHRRLLQAQAEAMGEITKEDGLKISHSREGSGSSNRSGGHSRQGSRDRTSPAQHSRQSSRELSANQAPAVVLDKSVEMYATLPKKKGGKVKPETIEDGEYMYDRPGRSLHSRGAGRRKEEEREKRARSEERNRSTREYLLGNAALTLPKDNKKEGKKQHKIRRKLLLGGLIRRKNRSMPDLREGAAGAATTGASQDDSAVGTGAGTGDRSAALSGYLSEGHLDCSGNPTMDRSRLMRKSFHGRLVHAARVPPPPPLRTTSQLTPSKEQDNRPPYPLPDTNYPSNQILHRLASSSHNEAVLDAYNNYNRASLPYEPAAYANGGVLLDRDQDGTFGSLQNLELPPYPSPPTSATHSRQASQDFPLPPPPLELLSPCGGVQESPDSLLAQLQRKRQQILEGEGPRREGEGEGPRPKSGEGWLRELQAKQAERRSKRGGGARGADAASGDGDVAPNSKEEGLSSVRDLASRFESIVGTQGCDTQPPSVLPRAEHFPSVDGHRTTANRAGVSPAVSRDHLADAPLEGGSSPVDGVAKSRADACEDSAVDGRRKKKNVTFCDQVILVATAEDEEDDSFIPNPILERVLRSACFKHDDGGCEPKMTTTTLLPLARECCPAEGGAQQSYRLDRQLHEAYVSSNLRPVSCHYSQQQSHTNYYQHASQPQQQTQAQTNYYQQTTTQPQQTQNPQQPQTNYYQQTTPTQPQQTQNPQQPQTNYYQQTTPTQPQQTQNPPHPQTSYYQQTTTQSQPPQTNYYQHTTTQPQQIQNPQQPQTNYHQQTPTQPQQTQNPQQPHTNYYQQTTTHPQQPQTNYYQPTTTQPQQIQNPQQPQTNYHQQSTTQPQQTQNPQQPQTNYYQQTSHTQQTQNVQSSLPPQNPSHVQTNYYQHSSQAQQNPPLQPQNCYQPQQIHPATAPHRQHQYQPNQAFANHQPVYQRLPGNQEVAQRTVHQEPVHRSAETGQRAAVAGQNQSTNQEAAHRHSAPAVRQQHSTLRQATPHPPYQHPPPPRHRPDDGVRASPCHLCRKKPIVPPAVYCADCHFYMSRFKPRTQ